MSTPRGCSRTLAEGSTRRASARPRLIGRLIGLDVPPELVPDEQDPERMRDAFLSALRAGIEALAEGVRS